MIGTRHVPPLTRALHEFSFRQSDPSIDATLGCARTTRHLVETCIRCILLHLLRFFNFYVTRAHTAPLTLPRLHVHGTIQQRGPGQNWLT